ncbi:uncharacterized protein [Elaeis guineensis]|uniref:uncharacterized protein n=1 Tax=Elaeis guineensis var. tenera TaxID=51953 RepID=UPI003C6D7C8F
MVGQSSGGDSGERKKVKRQQIEDLIIFTKKDAREVQFPHNDAVVVTLNLKNYDVCCISIDNRSSSDILSYDIFVKLELSATQLGRINSPLVRFTETTILMEGVITLTIKVGQYPCQSIVLVDFLIVRAPSAYNTILGQPGLNALQAIISAYYLKIKFPMTEGVGEVREEQDLARHCYNTPSKETDLLSPTLLKDWILVMS